MSATDTTVKTNSAENAGTKTMATSRTAGGWQVILKRELAAYFSSPIA